MVRVERLNFENDKVRSEKVAKNQLIRDLYVLVRNLGYSK